jgi:hypothetical protein
VISRADRALGSRHPSFASRNVVATARGVISFAHQNVFCHVERAAWLSIRSADYRNPCNYVFLLVYDDDDVAAILIIVVRKVIGNDLAMLHFPYPPTRGRVRGSGRAPIIPVIRGADYIEALFAGLLPRVREHQYMLMLQGFFDDSGSDRESPVFVLAGFVCSTECWKHFSVDWQEILDHDPPLDYFKMSEAQSFKGQFKRGWNPRLRDQRIFELADLINAYGRRDHGLVRIDCAMQRSHFEHFGRGLPGGAWSDPYFICFYYVITLCLEYLVGLDAKAFCEFIFDEQGNVGLQAIGWWNVARLLAGGSLGEMMGNPPIFRSDKRMTPLQAADLYAWQTRNFLQKNLKQDHPANEIAVRLASVAHLNHHVSQDDLLSLRQAALAM